MTMHLKQSEKDLIAFVRQLPKETRDVFLGALVPQNAIAITPVPKTYVSKKAVARGEGFACNATPRCLRTDLQTVGRAMAHATTQAELQKFGHAADHKSLPKG